MSASIPFKYSTARKPSLPMLGIEVMNYFGKMSPENGKIDTGSDGTSIPEYLVKKLELETTGEVVSVKGITGKPEPRDTYDVHIKIGTIKFDLLQVVALPRDNVLIGRDLINLWHMKLDGENQIGEITPWSTDPANAM